MGVSIRSLLVEREEKRSKEKVSKKKMIMCGALHRGKARLRVLVDGGRISEKTQKKEGRVGKGRVKLVKKKNGRFGTPY